ncbi:MAG: C1 family peptidase [Caedimonadaceae bacterium]|nr:MAG: C1 family peptidase [Caedimonadaceae bacterium]
MQKLVYSLLATVTFSSLAMADGPVTIHIPHPEEDGQFLQRKVRLNVVPSKTHHKSDTHYGKLIEDAKNRKALRGALKAQAGRVKSSAAKTLPDMVDMRGNVMAVQDQGEIGSCTAHAAQAMVDIELRSHGIKNPPPISRMYQYANSRFEDGAQPTITRTVSSSTFSSELADDSGATIAAAVKAILDYGAVPETLYPYSVKKFSKMPDAYLYPLGQGYINAMPVSAAPVAQNLDSIKSRLSKGKSVIIGINCYNSGILSQKAARTGLVDMPVSGEESQGGHAVLIVGYDDRPMVGGKANPYFNHFIIRNSWSLKWGNQGYFGLPYDYVLNEDITSELWSFVNTGDPLAPKDVISSNVAQVHQSAVVVTSDIISAKYEDKSAKNKALKDEVAELRSELASMKAKIASIAG